ncbi:hypothetical protein F6X37_16715 [Paraburkholderia sp. 31.1]|uniref:hypothetical protein n=1 Tax=Paraburkholderia sp. 31.1 TaxID=2615205 RepID=UPI001655BA46|nr:hypothetical protein [Paraburkholderia sp. 31.1]MBC8723167.1 hypothetical protein [Paraburkholderia sp. 31.1]
MNGLKAGNSVRVVAQEIATRNTAHSAAKVQRGETDGTGPDGLRTTENCVSGDRHASRLHGNRDVRKSVNTLREPDFSVDRIVADASLLSPLTGDLRARLPSECAVRARRAPETGALARREKRRRPAQKISGTQEPLAVNQRIPIAPVLQSNIS